MLFRSLKAHRKGLDMVLKIERLVLSVVALFAFIFIYDWVYHVVLMHDLYSNTASLWRKEDEMQGYFHWAVIVQLLFAFVVTLLYGRYAAGKGLDEGIRFGLYIGLVLGIMCFGMYAYMPIPLSMALAWLVGDIIKGIGIGVLLSLTYKAV